MAVNHVAIDRLQLDEAFTKKMLHRAFDNTIRIFGESEKSSNVDFENAVVLSCHVVLSRNFPATQSTIQDYQMAFALETGVYLSFDSETFWEKPEK